MNTKGCKNRQVAFWWGLLLCFSFVWVGCGTPMIAGTKVPATKNNVAIMSVLKDYKRAALKGRWDKVLNLVSTRYHDTNGTPDPNDDTGFSQLKKDFYSDAFKKVRLLRFFFVIETIKYPRQGEAEIDLKIQYTYQFPRGKYQPGLDTGFKKHRIVMAKENGRWMILKGI